MPVRRAALSRTAMRVSACLAAAVLAAVGAAHAAVYYVDGSSNGCAGSRCADSNDGKTEATAFASPTGCLGKPLAAGDTCLIKNGTYPGPNALPSYPLAGLNGTARSPIVIRNFPGHNPILCRGNGLGGCFSGEGNVVMGNTGPTAPFSYVTIQGLTLRGAVWMRNEIHHVTLTGNDISVGGGSCAAGTWAIIYISQSAPSNVNHIQIDHNYIHDLVGSSICGGGQAFAKLLMFVMSDSTIEYNTFDQTNGETSDISISLKDCPLNNVYRYNYVKQGTIWGPFQENCSNSTNNKIYGNVVVNGGIEPMKHGDHYLVYNNTFVNSSVYFNADSDPANLAITSVNFYNNIMSNPKTGGSCNSGGGTGCNVVVGYGAWSVKSGYLWDYNAYDSDSAYDGDKYGSNLVDTTLTGWRSTFGAPRDAHSFEGNSGTGGGPCKFSTSTDTPYHVAASTACKTGACADWPTCSTTTAEYGAYGVTTCVGNTCGVTAPGPDTTPPSRSAAAPSGVLATGVVQATLSLSTDESATCRYATTAGTAYAAMTTTFATTGGTSHASTVLGLVNGGAYGYYVRCIDAAGNANTDDYPINFSVSAIATASNCASAPPGTIFCDDFEDTNLAGRYTDYDSAGGRFAPTTTEAHSGTHSMSAQYLAGTNDAGHLWYNFGRNPASSLAQTSTDFNELYWRFWMKVPVGWTGQAYKLTRARVLAKADYTDAATGHLWGVSATPNLAMDPASGIATDGTTFLTSGYNDYPNYHWSGTVQGATNVYDAAHQGRWQCIEAHMKLNTPGQSDGVFEFWVDGNLDGQATGLNWRGLYTDYGINHVVLENYGDGSNHTVPFRYLDDFVVATQRVGCTGGQTDATPPANVTRLRRADQQ